jgi:50S ribosomal subunit-associated GTPase HflX
LKNCAIIGKTNVGKTLFFINFADYLGLKSLEMEFVDENTETVRKRYSLKGAVSKLTDDKPHKTLQTHSLMVDIPLGKGKKKIQLIDTVGLIDGIHSDEEVRRAISNTLAIIREASLILHLVDASVAGEVDLPNALGEVDYQVAQFAQLRRGYAVLANKMDLPGASLGLKKIQQEFSGNIVMPISAMYKRGFKEVKTFVAHNI